MLGGARVILPRNPSEEERKRLAQGTVVQGLGDSGGFRFPVLLTKYESEYPLAERSAGIQGTVALSATIGADGHPREIQVTKSIDPALDECARAAVAKWLFSPAKQDGVYIDAAANINVNFQLLAPGQPPRVDTLSSNFGASARSVTLYVQVGPEGNVSSMVVLRSLGSGFDQKAMEAAEKWPFQVVYEKAQPVGYSTVVNVEFQ
jgi:TonB family protein